MGAFLTQNQLRDQSMDGVGEFITDVQLRRQNGYAPTPGGDLRDYEVNNTETNL